MGTTARFCDPRRQREHCNRRGGLVFKAHFLSFALMGRKIAGGSSNGGSSSNGDSGSYERGAGGGSNKESRRILPAASDLKWLDQFPYFPSYRHHPYRSCCGAVGSIIMMSTLLLRVTSAMVDYVDRPPI